ncbi:MAG: hypothetical protein IPM60_08195 [Rhodospirillales bacterium]|nr:hypothetical protein [Rhodospirillales bacterium]
MDYKGLTLILHTFDDIGIQFQRPNGHKALDVSGLTAVACHESHRSAAIPGYLVQDLGAACGIFVRRISR